MGQWLTGHLKTNKGYCSINAVFQYVIQIHLSGLSAQENWTTSDNYYTLIINVEAVGKLGPF